MSNAGLKEQRADLSSTLAGSSAAQGAATDAFIDWLATVTVEKENAGGTGGGAGKARIVLCGHRSVQVCLLLGVRRRSRSSPRLTVKSYLCLLRLLSMGGLLASDALLKIARSRPDIGTALWPRIIGLLSFDTPVRPTPGILSL